MSYTIPVGRETPDIGNTEPTIDPKSNPIEKVTKAILHIQRINIQLIKLDKSKNENKIERYTYILNHVNDVINTLDSIDISKLPKHEVSDAWGLQPQNNNDPGNRQPPPPKDYEFVEGSAPYNAGTIIVRNFIWLTEDSKKEFTPDELKTKIKKLSTLKQLYSMLKTFLEKKIAELEKSKEVEAESVEVAEESVETPQTAAKQITEGAIQQAIEKLENKSGGRRRRTKRSTKRSSKRKHRKSRSSRR